MKINDMKRKDFEALPQKKWDEDIGVFNSIVILPGKANDLHDSGYRCMDFVAVKDGNAICRLSGCSDVIHVDGIGGYGDNWFEKYGRPPQSIPPSGWSIDCLAKSGLLHMWPNSHEMCCGLALSSFEIYAMPKRKILPHPTKNGFVVDENEGKSGG